MKFTNEILMNIAKKMDAQVATLILWKFGIVAIPLRFECSSLFFHFSTPLLRYELELFYCITIASKAFIYVFPVRLWLF